MQSDSLEKKAMFNIYLPRSIYERLPVIYLVLALVLVLLPLAPIKWVSIAALLLALAVTNKRRQASRGAGRLLAATAGKK